MNQLSDYLPVRAHWTENVDLVFLVGCPRSGTTWLQAMLASHPQICTGPESHFFATLAHSEQFFLKKDFSRGGGLAYYVSSESYYNVITNLFWSLISALPTPAMLPRYFLEKTPEHTLNGQFIMRSFPNARFIHLIRDARAVVASLLYAATSWGKAWAPKTALESVLLWRKYVKAGRDISHYVRSTAQYTEIKYEDLRQQPHENIQKLFAWLALPYDQQLIQSTVQSNSLQNAKLSPELFQSIVGSSAEVGEQARQTYPQGFIGSSPYQIEKIRLSRLQRLRVEHDAGELLCELGYANVRKQVTPWERIMISTKVRRMLGLPQI